MDLIRVFDAAPKSAWEVLCHPGTGFYIPAYQRDYAWGKDKVQRLIADSLHGLQLLVDKDDAITFIGTLIVLHDVRYQAVNPVVRDDLPKLCDQGYIIEHYECAGLGHTDAATTSIPHVIAWVNARIANEPLTDPCVINKPVDCAAP